MTNLFTSPRSTASHAAWHAARQRVESYLRAQRLADPAEISRLAADIIEIARTRARPGVDPVVLAMETVEMGVDAWLAHLQPEGPARAATASSGRLDLALGEVPARWPAWFLREGTVPPELHRTLRASAVEPAPEIQLVHMAPRAVWSAAANRPATARWSWLRPLSVLGMAVSRIGAAFTSGR